MSSPHKMAISAYFAAETPGPYWYRRDWYLSRIESNTEGWAFVVFPKLCGVNSGCSVTNFKPIGPLSMAAYDASRPLGPWLMIKSMHADAVGRPSLAATART